MHLQNKYHDNILKWRNEKKASNCFIHQKEVAVLMNKPHHATLINNIEYSTVIIKSRHWLIVCYLFLRFMHERSIMENLIYDFLTGYWFTTIFLFFILFIIVAPVLLICLCGIRFLFDWKRCEKGYRRWCKLHNTRHFLYQQDKH